MRVESRSARFPTTSVAGGVPVAIAGSLVLLVGASPAAAEPVRAVDADGPRLLGAMDGAAQATAKVRPSGARAASVVPDSYTVQPGDTVSSIASRHGLRTVDVLALNGLDWSTIIHPGDVLRLAAAAVEVAAPVAESAAPAPAEAAHTVQAGDTITAIAGSYGVTIDAILAANGLDRSSIIYPGQRILIPGATTVAPAVAPAAPPAESAPAPAPVPAAGSYVVVAGDTISAIAAAHGFSTQAVLDANGLSASAVIFPGQSIAIPGAMPVELVAATAPVASPSGDLDGEQIANAQIIIAIGRELGVPDQGIAVALGTAMQESWLRNLDWGDRDSLGLFQQRPSTGWGTPEQVSDPARATRAFYGGASDPNGHLTRGLLDIDGWQSMSFADTAQAVQISAYPDRYAQWEQPAYAWLAAYG